MILRLTGKLAKKVREIPRDVLPAAPNPYVDWTARLFTASRAQYIMLSNTRSLYTVLIHGAGVTSLSALSRRAFSQLADHMSQDGIQLIYDRVIAPDTRVLSISKTLSQSVTGSMNDLQHHTKDMLSGGMLSPWDAACRLNQTPMGALQYAFPVEAFRAMARTEP